MKRKFSSIIVATTLFCLLLLGGCGTKVPTAEELLDSAWGPDTIESIDMRVDLIFDVDVSLSALLGLDSNTSSDTSDTSSDTSMNMAFECRIDTLANETTQYTYSAVDASFFGMSSSQETQNYMTDIDGVKYSFKWDDNIDGWTKSEVDDDEDDGLFSGNFDISKIATFGSSVFDSYELQEPSEDDTVYTVTGTVNCVKLADMLDVDPSEILSDYVSEDVDYNNAKFNVTMTFDKDTLLCQTINFIFDVNTLDQNDIVINELAFTLTINQINNVDADVPQDVIDSAIPYAISSDEDDTESMDDTWNTSNDLYTFPDGSLGYDDDDNSSDSDLSNDTSESNSSSSNSDNDSPAFFYDYTK